VLESHISLAKKGVLLDSLGAGHTYKYIARFGVGSEIIITALHGWAI